MQIQLPFFLQIGLLFAGFLCFLFGGKLLHPFLCFDGDSLCPLTVSLTSNLCLFQVCGVVTVEALMISLVPICVAK